jgi:DNA-binding MarR family transcriptional regulator
MSSKSDPAEVGAALRVSVGLLVRRLRQVTTEGELTLSETSALARLDRGGPTTASALARLEQISPQSMGTTLARLEQLGMVSKHPDPEDGRRAVVSLSPSGLAALRARRDARDVELARALSSGFTQAEIDQLKRAVPLLERLAENI